MPTRPDPSALSRRDALLALEVSKLQEFTGRASPTVIT